MHRPFLPRRRGRQLLTAAAAVCASQTCRDDEPGGADTSPGTPDMLSMDGTNPDGPEDMGSPDMGTGAVDDLFSSFTWNSMIQSRISPSGVLHVAQFGGASTVYRMNYVGSAAQ